MLAKLNQHLDSPVSIIKVRKHLHKQKIYAGQQFSRHLSQMLMPNVVYNGVTLTEAGRLKNGSKGSDKSSFILIPTTGRVHAWRTLAQAYGCNCLLPSVKHGSGSIMIWAAVS
ncbi:hypothetical protein TNCV_478901 [Trichonephila clavipes]|nr:hypothetical protein TNCV_478901 [Trichonephila clavipes]